MSIAGHVRVAGSTLVTTRYLKYLPSHYVHLFLNAGGYTAKHIWQILLPILIQNQDAPVCQGLMNWLRVSTHGTAIQNAQ